MLTSAFGKVLSPSVLRRVASIVALAGAGAVLIPGCEKRATLEECDGWKGEAFALKNKAQPCATDADCKQSEWPPCESPVDTKTIDAIKPLKQKWDDGKCEAVAEEDRVAKKKQKMECRTPPEVYCKQGLCVHREVGKPELQEQEIQVQ
ncbi:MAG TPA: hypothetical protein VL400_17515 [Polyangiaceae bacterium]|nr:hypothetical protein [Polyangiaceae bacterium]